MPGLDRTGPQGMGSMTGRGMGLCGSRGGAPTSGQVPPGGFGWQGWGRGFGGGRGFGRGMGWGRGWGRGFGPGGGAWPEGVSAGARDELPVAPDYDRLVMENRELLARVEKLEKALKDKA